MHDHLQNLSQAALVEMLIEQTGRLTKLMTDHSFNEEYNKCKQMIEAISKKLEHNNPDLNGNIRGIDIPLFKE